MVVAVVAVGGVTKDVEEGEEETEGAVALRFLEDAKGFKPPRLIGSDAASVAAFGAGSRVATTVVQPTGTLIAAIFIVARKTKV